MGASISEPEEKLVFVPPELPPLPPVVKYDKIEFEVEDAEQIDAK
jgi:hypothetical protein